MHHFGVQKWDGGYRVIKSNQLFSFIFPQLDMSWTIQTSARYHINCSTFNTYRNWQAWTLRQGLAKRNNDKLVNSEILFQVVLFGTTYQVLNVTDKYCLAIPNYCLKENCRFCTYAYFHVFTARVQICDVRQCQYLFLCLYPQSHVMLWFPANKC